MFLVCLLLTCTPKNLSEKVALLALFLPYVVRSHGSGTIFGWVTVRSSSCTVAMKDNCYGLCQLEYNSLRMTSLHLQQKLTKGGDSKGWGAHQSSLCRPRSPVPNMNYVPDTESALGFMDHTRTGWWVMKCVLSCTYTHYQAPTVRVVRVYGFIAEWWFSKWRVKTVHLAQKSLLCLPSFWWIDANCPCYWDLIR